MTADPTARDIWDSLTNRMQERLKLFCGETGAMIVDHRSDKAMLKYGLIEIVAPPYAASLYIDFAVITDLGRQVYDAGQLPILAPMAEFIGNPFAGVEQTLADEIERLHTALNAANAALAERDGRLAAMETALRKICAPLPDEFKQSDAYKMYGGIIEATLKTVRNIAEETIDVEAIVHTWGMGK